MDYCHKLASAIWKKLVQDRELYAGLIIGLIENSNGDDESVSLSEDLHPDLQQHSPMILSSSRNDVFRTDPIFKKNGCKTTGQPREKRMMCRTEKERIMKASSSHNRDRQSCSFCKMNGCQVFNCIIIIFTAVHRVIWYQPSDDSFNYLCPNRLSHWKAFSRLLVSPTANA